MASAKDFPDVIREGDPLLGNSYRHYYGGSYYHLLFPDWPEGYRRDGEAAVYLEDKEEGEYRRLGNETLSEAVRRDYWRKIDEDNAHPMTDGPGPGFMRDLRQYAREHPTPAYIPFGGVDAFKRYPDLIPEGDPLMDHSYGHWYGETYYHLLFPDWPQGYRRDVQPAVYTLDSEKGAYRRLEDVLLSGKIAEHYWQDIDEQNRRMMDPPPGPFRTPGTENGNPALMGFMGMMDGSYMAPRPAETAAVRDPWTCPSCGRAGNTGRFCPECGGPRPAKAGEWTCPSCAQAGNSGNFCPGCGARRP